MLVIHLPAMGQASAFSRDQGYCEVDDTVSSFGAIVVSSKGIRRLKVLAPASARRGEEIELQTVVESLGGEGQRLQASAGGANMGVRPVRFSDGNYTVTQHNGVACWKVGLPDAPYLYWSVLKDADGRRDGILEVEIRYLDDAPGSFRLQYNSSDALAMPYRFGEYNADYKGSAWIHKRGTGIWRSARLVLPDAKLRGTMNGGADIRLDAAGGTHLIASIAIIPRAVIRKPVPNVTLMIGNERRRTDANGSLSYRFTAADPLGWYLFDARRNDRSMLLPASGRIKVIE